MKPANSVRSAVYAEQVGAVFRQMPIAVAVNFVNAGITAAVLAPIAIQPFVLPWFLLMTLVTAGRLVVWRGYQRSRRRQENSRFWSRLATWGSLLTGLCWGIGGVVLLPVIPDPGKILLTSVIAGMCAGAVVVNSSHLPTLLAFLLSATLPVSVHFFSQDSSVDNALGALVIVFAMALALAGKQFSRMFAEAMQLRFDLNEANLRLQAEMAQHQATEEALRQAQKLEAIGQLTGGIAHDFNNLMTVIIGNVELARARASKTSNVAPLLQGALQAAERGVSLIQRLLAFARKQALEPRSVDLGTLVFGIEDLLRRTLGPEIRLLISADPGLAPAHVDANQVELAILNLAINARDALPEGGTVRIVIENDNAGRGAPPELSPGEYVVLSLSDDGTGMDDTTLARAFDPFFTTKEVGSGSGLGLPMVQGFAAQSGGVVRVRSKLGEGTTIELWLPKAEEPPVAERLERTVPPGDGGAARVLFCDDDDGVRSLLGEYLQSIGYTVHEVSGGEEVVRVLDSGAEIDLLVIDYAMPGMNGLETIRQARLRQPDLRCLLITGHAGILSGDSTGVTLLRKPFQPRQLARQAAEILHGKD
jgi:signal transduction histidine kinase/CheY-like chemotaxis protein